MPHQDQGQKLLGRPSLIAAAAAVVIVGVALLVLTWLWPARGGQDARSDGKQPGPSTTTGSAAFDTRQRPAAPPVVFGTLLVNDSGSVEIGQGAPLYVRLILDPHPEKTVAVSVTDDVRPMMSVERRGAVTVDWDAMPVTGSSLAPGQPITVTWIAKTPVPAGAYEITLSGTSTLLRLAEAGLTGVRIAPGLLTVVEGAGDPRIAAHYHRRVLALRGRTEELLAGLETALRADPANLALGRELVDALELAGRPTDALRQLNVLAADIQARQMRAHPSVAPEMPDWVVFRLAELHQRAARSQ